jgi:hypothetical protein
VSEFEFWDTLQGRSARNDVMSMMRMVVRAVAAIGLIPLAAGAQSVRGVVVDRDDRPVSGVVVLLLDSASNPVARALSNDRGEFRIAGARGGSYRVRTMRIGFRPVTSPPIRLADGGEISQRLVLTGLPIGLDTVRVADRSSCHLDTDTAAATFAVWEQARTALTAVALTASQRAITATSVAYDRTVDRSGRRVLTEQSWIYSETVTRPWGSQPPDTLHHRGYISSADGSTMYYAPGLDALTSNEFVTDHCFKLEGSRDSAAVEIAFEPTPDRHVPEIAGTVRLDRRTSELRSLQFRYVNVPRALRADGPPGGGEMEFARMRGGGWVISRWSIRMPALQVKELNSAERPTLVGFSLTGGEVAMVRRGRDTLWSRPAISFAGSVVDSATGIPLAGATVALQGTTVSATTDALGQFRIGGILPGEYSVEVHTPSLDAVEAVHELMVTVVDSMQTVRIQTPTGEQVISALCRGGSTRWPGIVVGTVAVRDDTIPPARVKVVAEWSELTLLGGGGSVRGERRFRWIESHSDARGTFRICGVPIKTAIAVRAEYQDGSAGPIDVTIPEGKRFARTELEIERGRRIGAVFAGRVLTDSTLRPIADADVSLPDVSRSVTTNETGAFRIADVTPGTRRVMVRRVGYAPLDTVLSFRPNQTLQQDVVLSRVVMLDSVVVNERAVIPSFEENRRLGLGHFITRDQLAAREGHPLANVLSDLSGVQFTRGRGRQSWIRSSRAASSLSGTGTYCGNEYDKSQGMTCACYVQVYIDGVLMNRPEKSSSGGREGRGTELYGSPGFDVSAYAPEQIEAIEFYSGPAQTPAKYSILGAVCGVLVLWTRRSQ